MNFAKLLFFVFLLSALSVAKAAESLMDIAMDLNIEPETGMEFVELINGEGGICSDWIADKGWEEGDNKKKDGGFFFVQVGSGIIAAPPGHKNYINSRQNAFSKAMLTAKGNIISSIAQTVESELMLSVKQGSFTEDESIKKNKLMSSFNKAVDLLNAELDEHLKEKGLINATEAEKESLAKQKLIGILNSEKFRQITQTSAAQSLRGVRRIFVNESIMKGEQGEICVVALYSTKTMQLADAIVSGDFSLAPKGKKGKKLKDQIPNKKTQDGLRQLLTTYGVEMLRDEEGEFNLVSYAQAGPQTKSKTSLKIAYDQSKIKASAQLASFANENASLKERQESSEASNEYGNDVIDYSSVAAYEKDLQSITDPIVLEGLKRFGKWAAKHPATGQIVTGSIMVWSASSAKAAQKSQTTLISDSVSDESQTFDQADSFSGSSAGGSSENDF